MCCIPEGVQSYHLQKPYSNIFSPWSEIWRILQLWKHCLVSYKPMPSDTSLFTDSMNWTWWMKCVTCHSSRNLLQPCWLLWKAWKCFNMVCVVSSRFDQLTDEWMLAEWLTHGTANKYSWNIGIKKSRGGHFKRAIFYSVGAIQFGVWAFCNKWLLCGEWVWLRICSQVLKAFEKPKTTFTRLQAYVLSANFWLLCMNVPLTHLAA